MKTVTLKKITIIAEEILASHLIGDLKKLGAKGFSRSSVSGEGTRNLRRNTGENVKLEAIVSQSVSDQILGYMFEHYFEDYAMIAYSENVEVIRGEKYV